MSPRTAEQYQALREGSRARILQSAMALFARFGYERTTVRMIAQDAGVSQGLLYNYFESKEAVLRALFEQSMRDVQESFGPIEDAATPQEGLERLIRGSFEIVQRNLRFWKLSYGVRMQPAVLEGLGEDLVQWEAAIRSTLETLCRDLGVPDPAIEAEILFALIDGISQHYALEPDRYPLEAVADGVVAKYRRMDTWSCEQQH